MKVLMPAVRVQRTANFKTGTIVEKGMNYIGGLVYKSVTIGKNNNSAKDVIATKTFYYRNKPENIHKTVRMTENCEGVVLLQKKTCIKHEIQKSIKKLFHQFKAKNDWEFVDSKINYSFDLPKQQKNYNIISL